MSPRADGQPPPPPPPSPPPPVAAAVPAEATATGVDRRVEVGRERGEALLTGLRADLAGGGRAAVALAQLVVDGLDLRQQRRVRHQRDTARAEDEPELRRRVPAIGQRGADGVLALVRAGDERLARRGQPHARARHEPDQLRALAPHQVARREVLVHGVAQAAGQVAAPAGEPADRALDRLAVRAGDRPEALVEL